MSLDGLHISLALVRSPLLGVRRRGVLSSHMINPAFWRVWHLTIGLFCFKSWVSNTLEFRKKLMNPLRSLGLPCWCFWYQPFSKGGSQVSGKFLDVSAQFGSSILSNLFEGLHYCYKFADRLTTCLKAFLRALACPLVPGFLEGSLKCSEGLIWYCKKCPGKYSPCIMFALSLDEECFDKLLPFSLTDFLVWTSFLVLCEKERIKYM